MIIRITCGYEQTNKKISKEKYSKLTLITLLKQPGHATFERPYLDKCTIRYNIKNKWYDLAIEIIFSVIFGAGEIRKWKTDQNGSSLYEIVINTDS